jgi:hypothetical protein
MNPDRLRHIEDLTRRYARYRPCGAGLGVVWAGMLLALLGALLIQWTGSAYASLGTPSESFWRFLRSRELVPPGWLVAAAAATPFLAWVGLNRIQRWVDRRFGTVQSQEPPDTYPRGPRWFFPAVVVFMACLLCGMLVWDAATGFAAWGAAGIVAIAVWAILWGRWSRDRLSQFVMFAVSIPPLYLLASTDVESRLAAGNLIIFATYMVLMFWLLIKGATRFSGFVKVRGELAAIEPVDE